MQHPDVSLQTIQAARERIAGRIRATPVLENQALNELAGAQLYFKCENFQEGGAFKARGATNAVFALSTDELRGGVVTHSSGNHGAALARAAMLRGVRARIVMPENSSRAKLAMRCAAMAVKCSCASRHWRRARRWRRSWWQTAARRSSTPTTMRA
jgi:threonine dehydratase